jgi:hypothetical protein
MLLKMKFVALGALFLLNVQCTNPPSVTKGRNKFGLVQFPGMFVRNDPDIKGESIINSHLYEVRKAPDSSELLFGMQDHGGEYSDNFYSVSLDGRFSVHPANVQEWEHSGPLPNTKQGGVTVRQDFDITREGVKYQGRLYPTDTGESWTETKVFLSPSKRWLAVFSDTSKPAHRPGIAGFGGGGRTSGEMIVDVYDTSSGEKVMSGRSPHKGDAGTLISNALWIDGDRYLLIPLGPSFWQRKGLSVEGESCFLGILP